MLSFTSEDKLYSPYLSFAHGFLYQGQRHVKFSDLIEAKCLKEAKLQALLPDGSPFQRTSVQRKKMPPYCKVSDAFLIRDDLFSANRFNNLTGVAFINIEVDGVFPYQYKALTFSHIINCVDRERSVRCQLDFFSNLVLDKSQIPTSLNGFFLSGWDLFGGIRCIVDKELKQSLQTLEGLSSFFVFEEL